MTKYLYGAAVQGIQGFIFQTNELKDVVGASELINFICEDAFDEFGGKSKDSVLRAAGNIKHIFDNEDKCKEAVREFPKKVMELAPGITISQAVVKINDGDFKKAVDELEILLKVQRNKQVTNNIGLMGMERVRKTGLPLVEISEGEHLDLATQSKRKKAKQGRENSTKVLCDKCFGYEVKHERIAYNIEKITQKNDWIAIIHADGNGLGQVVQKIGGNANNFKKFSQELNNATIEAAVEAYNHVAKKFNFDENDVIPIRPIVLGGDDLTIICRADIAIDYTSVFLKAFETKTNQKLGQLLKNDNVFNENENKLTACAGIAFIKSSFPFYYGYDLAEELCKAAKKDAKNNIAEGDLPKSCLMFHKVQDSFISDYDEIVRRELTPQSNISFNFGPYYLNEQKDKSVDNLLKSVELLNTTEGNAVKSHLRQWISMLYENPESARQKIKRLLTMLDLKETSEAKSLKDFAKNATKLVTPETICPVYDILSLHSIVHQDTKNKT